MKMFCRDENQKIVIIQKDLEFYRIPFYEKLKLLCNKNNIEIVLIYGNTEMPFNRADLEWAVKINNFRIRFLNFTLYWQPCLKHLKNADLIVVEQANKLLLNYVLWILNLAKNKNLAFWGHGKNFQAKNPNNLAEKVKGFMSKRVHWWFAYNELSANIIKELGFPKNRITVVNNTIDSEEIIKIKNSITENDIIAFKGKYNIQSENMGLFIGGMYAEKNLVFLLKSVLMIKEEIKDFEMVFIGAGQDQNIIEKFVQSYEWAHYLGPKFGKDKILAFMISKILLIPGAVGLAILDSFVLGVPLIATHKNCNGPEIYYLKNNLNGIIVNHSIDKYSETVVNLIKNEKQRAKLVQGCLESAKYYTLDKMVDNFFEGVQKAICQ